MGILHAILHGAALLVWYVVAGSLALIVIAVGGSLSLIVLIAILEPLFAPSPPKGGTTGPINPYANTLETKP